VARHRRRGGGRASVTAAALAGLLMGAPPLWAQDPIHKMGRGVANLLTGWIELPKHLLQGSRMDNPLIGLGQGLLVGTGYTLLRGGLGLYETLTFCLPYPSQYASPYAQRQLTDYAWE
jgi:putative exosortase-associated protein (TIGR04073 family)